MDKGKINDLLNKYLQGSATQAEEQFLFDWYKTFQKDERAWMEEKLGDYEETRKKILNKVADEIDNQERKVIPQKRNWLLFAASIVILISAGILFTQPKQKIQEPISSIITPGAKKATLTLSNGEKVSLAEKGNGKIAEQEGFTITKVKDGLLEYISNPTESTGTTTILSFNIIETPKGGNYQVILPDGTKVWLNAASSLKYPTQFSTNQRRVILLGEGYFEVTEDKSKPFIVATATQKIEVLGTHFNVNAYPDETETTTTLLEGAVNIKPKYENATAKVLKPGQQAVLTANTFDIRTVSADEAIAWKEGYFVFNNEDIKTAMRKLARWYNLEISFQGDLSEIYFGGSFSKNNSLRETLDILESTNKFKCKIEGRRMTIIK